MTGARAGRPAAIRIDADNEWAWCGERRLSLTPRSFAVLRYLVERPGRLITKDDLLATVWRDAIVSDAALASCIRDLRRALGDSSSAPRYIQTVHRRGFRFIGPVAPAAPATSAASPRDHGPSLSAIRPGPALVGRDAELEWLRQRFERALGGKRQVVFVTGEPGIGKTALVEAFVAELADRTAVRIGRGQCVEQYGAGEPYLPVLEALGRLGRSAGREQLVQVLRQHAPTWLAQLPGLLADHDIEAVQRRTHGATRERMLRELVDAVEALTRDVPLLLLLEDLHWSDFATLDLLGMLARRPDAARLMVVGSFRPEDVPGAAHPLRAMKQELHMHGYCEELRLGFLALSAVEDYIRRRCPGAGFAAELARVLHRNTDGNPLFLVSTVDDLIAQGQLREVDGRWQLAGPAETIAARTPRTLSQVVERQIERLSAEEQAVLAIGSVAGPEFSAALSVANGIDIGDGERWCESLARRGQFVRAAGIAEWPDGTVAAQYAFIHALYQQALYARIPIGRRVGLHLRTGERLEGGYGERAAEIASELAMHFERGRDSERAARYHRQAGERALRQHAYREAADHASRALELLATSADSPERVQQELAVQVILGAALTATHGYGAAEVARPYERARELCGQLGDTVRLLPVLLGLGRFHQSRGELGIARDLGKRLEAIAESTGDRTVGLAAHNALGIMAFYAGEFDTALGHLEQALARYDPHQHSPDRALAFRAGQDPGVSCAVYAAWTLQVLGHPVRARARMQEALARARALDHPFSVVYACHFAAGLHVVRREPEAVEQLEGEALACSTEHGFRLFPMMGAIHRGWSSARQGRPDEGLAQMRDGLAAMRAMGIELRRPAFLALMAEVCEMSDQPEAGLASVAEALGSAEQTGQRYWDAELYRLKGVLAIRSARRAGQLDARSDTARAAESSLLEAIAIARRQRARSFELRAATSVSRLWMDMGRAAEARAVLSEIYAGFTEGFDAPDLVDAKSLLDVLARRG